MAGKLDLEIDQGATFTRVFTWKDGDGQAVDLTGYAARLQVRETFGSSGPVLEFTSDLGGGLALGGSAGTIALEIAAAQTAGLAVPDDGSERPVRTLVYDLELSVGTYVKRLIQGTFLVSKEVTR